MFVFFQMALKRKKEYLMKLNKDEATETINKNGRVFSSVNFWTSPQREGEGPEMK